MSLACGIPDTQILGHSVFPKLVESLGRGSRAFWRGREKSGRLPLCVLRFLTAWAAMCRSVSRRLPLGSAFSSTA